jgi:hypothetical protein
MKADALLAGYLSGPRLEGDELAEAMDKIAAAFREESNPPPKVTNAERQARYRARKRNEALQSNVTRNGVTESVTSVTCVTVTPVTQIVENVEKTAEICDVDGVTPNVTHRNVVTLLPRARDITKPSSNLLSSSLFASTDRQESKSPRARMRGSFLPDDWTLPGDGRAYARDRGMTDEMMAEEAEKFADHWRQDASPKAVKRDWPAAWRTWVRNSKRFAETEPLARSANASAAPTLEQQVAQWKALL